MATSLIEKLNAIQNLTPDEIAKRLAPHHFIRCGTMTRDQWDHLSDKPVAFYSTLAVSWEASSRTPRFRVRLGSEPTTDWRDYEEFARGYWEGWWVIAQADHYEGIKCPTLSSV